MTLIIDNFAGGGGASLGIELGCGQPVDFAINHDAPAIAMHAANHRHTTHLTANVWDVKPLQLTGGAPVGLAWFSPDCKHFSRAKGGKPADKRIRGLAWVAVRWAEAVQPGLIVLENVREFQGWGPLGADNRPDPNRVGLTFRRFTGRLRNLGYNVQWRELNAADFGAPTHRRRLFLIARCDGLPIVWPEPTHCDPRKVGERTLFAVPRVPWRTAAECIDWSLPCPSIFDRKRPLAPKTLRRIAMGIKRYVLDNPRPFIVGVGGRAGQSPATPADAPVGTITGKNDRAVVTPIMVEVQNASSEKGHRPVTDPMHTVTVNPKGGGMAVVAPILAHVNHAGERRAHSPTEPMPTITGAHRGEVAVIAPTLVQTGFGERDGQAPRALDIEAPLGTVVAGGQKHALVEAFLAKHYGGVVGHELDRPIGTVTSVDHHSLVTAHITQFRGTNQGKGDPSEPVPALTAGGQHVGVVAAHLIRNNHRSNQSSGLDAPTQTVTTQTNKAGLVYAFLASFYGNGDNCHGANEPMATVTTKDRHGLVIVHVDGVPHAIVDIGLRMLTPRELARAQGFPDSYILTGSKSNQVAKIGNSVCPPVAAAIVRANYRSGERKATA